MGNSIEEDIKILEENLKNDTIYVNCGNSIDKALENLLTRYKQLDSLIGEIDNKEVNDALHMLLHCSLKDTEYETQKQQFQIVNAYIKQLEEENKELLEVKISASAHNRIMELEEENKQLEAIKDEAIRKYNFESIPVSKVKEKIEELKKDVINLDTYPNFSEQEVHREIVEVLQELLREE